MEKEERVNKLYSIIANNLEHMKNKYNINYDINTSPLKSVIVECLKEIVESNRDYLINESLISYLITRLTSNHLGIFDHDSFCNYMKILSSNNDSLIIIQIIKMYLVNLTICLTNNESWAFRGTLLAEEGQNILKKLSDVGRQILTKFVKLDDQLSNIKCLTYHDHSDLRGVLYVYASKAMILNDYDYFINKSNYLMTNYNELLAKLQFVNFLDPKEGLDVKTKNSEEFINYIINIESAKKLIIE